MLTYKKALEEKRKDKLPYEHYKSIFKDFSPEKMSQNTGCFYDSEKRELKIKLMGNYYIVKYPSGEVLKDDYTDIKKYPIKTLILRYLINGGGTLPLNKDITYRDIPGGNVYYKNFYGRCIARLSKTFGNNIDVFKKAFQTLGAKEVNLGDAAYRFEFINNVFIVFILWEGDDEFPPSAQILFDANISDYFDAEDLAFVGDISIGTIKKLAYGK